MAATEPNEQCDIWVYRIRSFTESAELILSPGLALPADMQNIAVLQEFYLSKVCY